MRSQDFDTDHCECALNPVGSSRNGRRGAGVRAARHPPDRLEIDRIDPCSVEQIATNVDVNHPDVESGAFRRLRPVNWFSDADDARRYITEISRIWAVWIIGLAALFAVTNWWVLLGGIAILGVLVWLIKPIQRRANGIDDPGEIVEGSGGRFGGSRSRGEMALRVLMYGEAPLTEAIEEYGVWSGWVWVRRAVIAATAVAFSVVLLDIFQGSQ